MLTVRHGIFYALQSDTALTNFSPSHAASGNGRHWIRSAHACCYPSLMDPNVLLMPRSSVFDVAADIGAGLAKAALAGVVDGREVDTSHVIERDTSLSILTDRDEAAIEIIRHSTAHLLAQAVQQLFPGTQVTIGPTVEDGFYYDFASGHNFTPEDLENIEKRMAEIAAR